MRVDVQSGARSLVSGGLENRGIGPAFITPSDAVLEDNRSLIVIDCRGSCPSQARANAFMPAVVRVNLDSGDRTIISGGDDNIGSGPPLTLPTDVVIQPDRSLIVVGGFIFTSSVTQVDLNGDRAVISGGDDNIGSGPSLVLPTGVVATPDGSVIIADFFFGAVVQVDLQSGNRTVLSR